MEEDRTPSTTLLLMNRGSHLFSLESSSAHEDITVSCKQALKKAANPLIPSKIFFFALLLLAILTEPRAPQKAEGLPLSPSPLLHIHHLPEMAGKWPHAESFELRCDIRCGDDAALFGSGWRGRSRRARYWKAAHCE